MSKESLYDKVISSLRYVVSFQIDRNSYIRMAGKKIYLEAIWMTHSLPMPDDTFTEISIHFKKGERLTFNTSPLSLEGWGEDEEEDTLRKLLVGYPVKYKGVEYPISDSREIQMILEPKARKVSIYAMIEIDGKYHQLRRLDEDGIAEYSNEDI